jgi:hypothetical protein
VSDALARLFEGAVAPIDVRDLGAGARLLVPNGAAFGTPQLWHDGRPWDWVRHRADAYWIEGDRGSQHSGADLGFFTRRGRVHLLPVGLPVRAPCAGRLECAGADADPERGSEGVVLVLGMARRPRLYVHLADFEVRARRGARVRRGQILGVTAPYSRAYPMVVLHFGIGVLVPGAPPNALDPTPLLRRWRVRHPVAPESTCNASALNRGRPGSWRAKGVVDDLETAATWRAEWRDSW